MSRSGSDLFIVDNSDSDWKVHRYLKEWCHLSKAIGVAPILKCWMEIH